MKKLFVILTTVILLASIMCVSVFAASPSQIYIRQTPVAGLKMTGSLHCSASTGTYIRTATPLTRTDYVGNVSTNLSAKFNARLYTNYTAGPLSGALQVNVYTDGYWQPGNYLRQERIFESTENIIKAASYHSITMLDGTKFTLTQGQYLSYDAFVTDIAANSTNYYFL